MNERQKTILVAEDDTAINHLICKILKKGGYRAVSAFSGTEAELRFDMETYDLVILDLMMPGMDGESLLQKIRTDRKSEIPVLILSAKSALEDKVTLLKGGADDYMTKPFEPDELLARVYALLRRSGIKGGRIESVSEEEILTFKNLKLLKKGRQASVKEKLLTLTPYEYEILLLLMEEPDKVFSRESLYEKVWKGGYYGEDNTVNVHVSNLRKKIAAVDREEEYIKTVWGIGFKMA
ncbi:MAG: response regulator transcription factor [Eubacteriales bacterium]|nr:response regulator transcription factor [Eubacteriales bacterium]